VAPVIAWLTGCVLGFVGSIPAAGPLALLIVTSGLQRDPRRGVRLAIGGALAESIYALLAFLGLGAILTRSPSVMPIARACAAVVIIAIGIAVVRRRPPPPDAAPPASGASSYLVGFSLVALNPAFLVTWVGFAAAIAGYPSLRAAMEHPAWLAAGAFVGIVGWFFVLLAIARRSESKVRPETLARVVRVLGFVLVLMGAWLAIDALRTVLT
jgi:threonine/homoserine/homoserine lactone efflux protein